ncbi:MAG: hypothetical protein CMJ20_04700 [Phycisphaeraceae bacterium]|nr:hypothetical protein [Phycisphaeraceae bacterium]
MNIGRFLKTCTNYNDGNLIISRHSLLQTCIAIIYMPSLRYGRRRSAQAEEMMTMVKLVLLIMLDGSLFTGIGALLGYMMF